MSVPSPEVFIARENSMCLKNWMMESKRKQVKSVARERGIEEAHHLPLGYLYFYPHNIEEPLKFNLGSSRLIIAILNN